MSDFALKREKITQQFDFAVIVSEFENGSEQRRLQHANKVIGFKVETPPLTYDQFQAYQSFFISKYGALQKFTFTNPFDNTEYNVRFVPQTFETVFESGFYKAKFDFKVVT